MSATDTAKVIRDTIRAMTERVAAFRAKATGTSGGMITIRRLTATQDDAAAYARIRGFRIAANEWVLALPNGGEPVILGAIDIAQPAAYTLDGHLIRGGGPPSAVLTAAAGSGATISVNGCDDGFRLTLITGSSGLASGKLITVTFANARAGTEYAIAFSAGDSDARAATGKVGPEYATRSTTSFEIWTDAALPASKSHIWMVQIGEAA
jgi:hypothetical protein